MTDEDDTTVYDVVVNHEEQYSIWPVGRDLPGGWDRAGKQGPKSECLSHINEVWTDMRPLSLRKKMAELQERRPELEREAAQRLEQEAQEPADPRDDLVAFLCDGTHPVTAWLQPKKTVYLLEDALKRGFVHVQFTDTRGGTVLGIELDTAASEIGHANFDKAEGTVHIEGDLMLDESNVRCIADIDLATLAGSGRLERVAAH
ncbi:MbtH family NRPS accessory protein [Roseivivax sp. CAU 1753]